MDTLEKRKRFIVNSGYVFVIAVILYLFFTYAMGWLMPFILGFLIAYMVNPIVNFITKKLPLKRGIVSTLVIILIYAIIVLVLIFIIIELVLVIQNALNDFPSFYETQIRPVFLFFGDLITDTIAKLSPTWQANLASAQTDIMTNLKDVLINASQQSLVGITNFSAQIPGFLFAFFFTIIASLFIGAQFPQIKNFLMTQLSEKNRMLVSDTKEIFLDTVIKYIKAHIKLMLLMFVQIAIGLLILGQPNAIAIAFGISIFDLIPVFGTGIILIPWIIIALIQGNFGFAIGLIIINVIITIVRQFLEPKIVGKQLGINPLVALIAIYLGFLWWGIPGMILMPIATQIALTLHYSGKVKLFKNDKSEDNKEATETPMVKEKN